MENLQKEIVKLYKVVNFHNLKKIFKKLLPQHGRHLGFLKSHIFEKHFSIIKINFNHLPRENNINDVNFSKEKYFLLNWNLVGAFFEILLPFWRPYWIFHISKILSKIIFHQHFQFIILLTKIEEIM